MRDVIYYYASTINQLNFTNASGSTIISVLTFTSELISMIYDQTIKQNQSFFTVQIFCSKMCTHLYGV